MYWWSKSAISLMPLSFERVELALRTQKTVNIFHKIKHEHVVMYRQPLRLLPSSFHVSCTRPISATA